MFVDRVDAGMQLGKALEKYRGRDVLVLAIPRGGVEVGYQVARHLDSEFSILVTRKLPYPYNPEAGFGAITEDGTRIVLGDAIQDLPPQTVDQVIEEQQKELERRIKVLRGDQPLPQLENRTVILVDDGIAMGSTLRASIELCKKKGAGKIIAAVPVAGPHVAKEIAAMVDEMVVLETPAFFRAVAQVYDEWHDVEDHNVLDILDRWEQEQEETTENDE